jgi:hypothetical protein
MEHVTLLENMRNFHKSLIGKPERWKKKKENASRRMEN